MKYVLLFMLAAASPAIAAPETGNANAGKVAFTQCGGCHSLTPGKTMVGPSLAGVIGRSIASVPGYVYSKALQGGKGKRWTPALLEAYLANPNAMFPGNKMGIAVVNPKTRGDIAAYLATRPVK